jgi:phage shock protein C
MSATETYARRGFYRSSDRALLGGVCAGLADYFGFNLRVLRFLAIIAFVVAMPMAVIAYLAAVFLIPARPGTAYERPARPAKKKQSRRERKRARKEARRQQEAGPSEAAIEVRDKCRSLDKRLADLEKHITSSRYQLDREIRNL